MKTQGFLGRFFLLTLVVLIGFTSCDQADAEVTSASMAALVSVDNDGSTSIDEQSLKEIYNESSGKLSDELADWLKFMREEEKLARDIYTSFHELYGFRIFGNILKAEQNHMDVVLSYLEDYDLEDPSLNEAGVFTNTKLQELYNELLEKGSESADEALKVGALIEEVDIIDLAEVYELNPGEDIIALTEALMLGSRNHLRAFTRVLGFRDVVYIPELLSQDDYDEIIDTGWERGTGLCRKIDTQDSDQYSYTRGKGFRKR